MTMKKEEAAPTPTERPVDVIDADEVPAWVGKLLEDQKQEVALTAKVEAKETTYINKLARLEDATAILERRASMLSSLRRMAVRETNPQDWVIGRAKDGKESAMPGKVACDKIADVYGIELFGLAPVGDNGMFAPDVLVDEKDRATLRAWCGARSAATGREIPSPMIEAARREDEDFLGRSDHPADHRSAVLTLLRSKAARVLSGLSSIPKEQLVEAWAGTKKNADDCTKGHGYGSSADRAAQAVAQEGVPEATKKLASEIMARVGGDNEAAKSLLKEITANPASTPPFRGFDSFARFTQGWQVENAWKKLRAHKTFGDKASNLPENGFAASDPEQEQK